MTPLQTNPLLRTAPQAAQDTLASPDTLAAQAPADSASFTERLLADSTIYRITDPQGLRELAEELSNWLLDIELWVSLLGIIVQILVILLLAWVALRVVHNVTHRWTMRYEALPAVHPRRQRAYTISNLISSTARYVIWPVAIIMVLSTIDIDVGALIATAGVAGLAVGFGAQTLVKDVISGIFLLFDDTIHVGDLVRVGTESGTVEDIGVRLIRVRKFDGEVLMVPAGELRIFGNRSIGFVRVIVNVNLPYEQDLETILPVMDRVAREWAAGRKDILLEEEPSIQAITQFGEYFVTARIVIQVIPGEQFAAERELRVLLKREFDRLGVEMPFPRRTVYTREEKALPPRAIFDPDAPTTDPNVQGSD